MRVGSKFLPYCKKCHDCIPIRLNVSKFVLSRSQKRCKNKNKQVTAEAKKPVYDKNQYQIYAQYVTSRHPGGGMDEPELKIIDVFICKLRKKLAAYTGDENYIETVWGRGYVLREPDGYEDERESA